MIPFCHHLPKNSIFWPFLAILYHFCLLLSKLFAPTLLVLTNIFSLSAVAMISVKREQLLTTLTQFSRHLPENSISKYFGPFLNHLCLLMGDPSFPPLLSLSKMLSLGAVAMISIERELLQAITTPFLHHLPKNLFFCHFWLFFTICPCTWAAP